MPVSAINSKEVIGSSIPPKIASLSLRPKNEHATWSENYRVSKMTKATLSSLPRWSKKKQNLTLEEIATKILSFKITRAGSGFRVHVSVAAAPDLRWLTSSPPRSTRAAVFAPQMRLPLKLETHELMTDKRRDIHGNENITQPDELSVFPLFAINKDVLERYFLNANLKDS